MKKMISILLACSVAIGVMMPTFAAETESTQIYVSTTGDDTKDGTSLNAAVRTPARAQELARSYKSENKKTEIIFTEGTYELDDTLALTAEDSGYENAPIIYRAKQGDEVSFTIANKYDDFEAVSGMSGVYKTSIADLSEDFSVSNIDAMRTTLYAGGKMGVPAHSATFAATVDASGNKYVPTDKIDDWSSEPRVYKQFKGSAYSWSMSDKSYGTVASDGSFTTSYALTNSYTFYNILSELDEAGEYYIDITARELYYMPVGDIADGVYLSIADKPVVSIDSASNISFESIDFFGGHGNGIYMTDASNITVYDATMKGFAEEAIYAEKSSDVLVCATNISDLKRGGIYVSSIDELQNGTGANLESNGISKEQVNLTPSNNIIRNCRVTNYCNLFKTGGTGISFGGVGVLVQNNEVAYSPNVGIRFSGNDHIIEKNIVHDVILEVSDAGAIYAMRGWIDRGTVIRNNYIYANPSNSIDTDFTTIKGWQHYEANSESQAIYMDDMQSGITIEGNIIYNMSRGFLFGGGSDMIVKNNLIVDTRRGIEYDAGGTSNRQQHLDETDPYSGYAYRAVKALLADEDYDAATWAKYNGFTDMLARIEAFDNTTANGMTMLEIAEKVDTLRDDIKALEETAKTLTGDELTAVNTTIAAKEAEIETLRSSREAALDVLGNVYNRQLSNNVYVGSWMEWGGGIYTPENAEGKSNGDTWTDSLGNSWKLNNGVYQILFNGSYVNAPWQVKMHEDIVGDDVSGTYTITTKAAAGVEVASDYTITATATGLTATTADMGVAQETGYAPSHTADEIKNEANSFTAVAAIYDGNKLVAVQTKQDMYYFDGQEVQVDITVPEGATSTWYAKLMLWDTVTGLTPVMSQPISFGATN